jgi:hypothetical protein
MNDINLWLGTFEPMPEAAREATIPIRAIPIKSKKLKTN